MCSGKVAGNTTGSLVVVGLMAGTSLDGIDVVLARTDGHRLERLRPAVTRGYSDDTRQMIEVAVSLAGSVVEHTELLDELNQRITDEHAEALFEVMEAATGAGKSVGATTATVTSDERPELIGFHGQTVWHAPESGLSLQLGDPQRLAERVGIDVIAELRQADLAAGGQGAPLAPIYHLALLEQAGITGPAAWLNLGGVANLTLVDGEVTAGFDCGPANALMDYVARERLGVPWDHGGENALAGKVDAELVDQLLADDFFDQAPPKSLDRDHFLSSAALAATERLPVNDALATLAAFTVASVAQGLAWSQRSVKTLLVSGGGVHNGAVMQGLEESVGRVSGCRVITSDTIGVPADGVEAELVAFLAARCLHGLATSFPVTTGADKPVVGGRRFTSRARS